MSGNPEESTNPEHNLTPAEVDNLNRLEAVAERGLGTYAEVGDALAEIRDRRLYRGTHPSFEAYVRERWGVGTAPRRKPCEALASACEETLSAIPGSDRMDIEIRVDVRRHEDPLATADSRSSGAREVGEPTREELLPTLRLLLTEAAATVGAVAHQLESRAADIDDGARERLRNDVLVLDGEVAVITALLFEPVDWDSELKRLLEEELPPLDTDTDPEDE